MNFDDYRLLIPDYLKQQLDASAQAGFEQQLAVDPQLRAEVAELRTLWEDLALLPQAHPSAALRARFYQQLNAVTRNESPQPKLSRRWFPTLSSRPSPQLAIALVVFVAGILVGRFTHSVSNTEVAQLRTEVQSMRQLVALSLMDRQSATARLEGVSWSGRVDSPDREVSGALLHALNHDPNVNVRLSSVDALEKFASDASVREALLEAIPTQESPLVQIALIDALVQIHYTQASAELRKAAANTDYNVNVRQRAAWAVTKLANQ